MWPSTKLKPQNGLKWNYYIREICPETKFGDNRISGNTWNIRILFFPELSLYQWFCINGLALNPDKSDAIWFSTRQRETSLPAVLSVNVAGTVVPLSDTLKTLGILLDKRLSMDTHVAAVCKSAYFHTRALRHIRPLLSDDMAKSIAISVVSSRLDYANSVLYGTSTANINKLQRVQNTLAKVVVNNKFCSSAEALHQLHWLPIKQRINFKISTITYRILQSGLPSYLSHTIHYHIPSRTLRSNALYFLNLSLIHIWRCRRIERCRSRWSPYH